MYRLMFAMPSKSSSPTSAYLSLDQVMSFGTTGVLAAYWRKLLEIYVAAHCDTFSLSGVDSTERMANVACFGDWQPTIRDRAFIRTEWDTPASGRRWYDEEHSRFPIEVETIQRLTQPEFRDWFVSSEDYPADRLAFFSGSDLILEAEPNELGLLFYQLTPARRDLLWHIEPDAFRTLDFSRNWAARTLRVSEFSEGE